MCFYEDLEILCYNPDTNEEYYKKVKNIKKNEYVKSYGTEKEYSKVKYIGCIYSVNNYKNLHIIDNKKKHFYQHKLYKNIILTGYHSILLKDPSTNQLLLTSKEYDTYNYKNNKTVEYFKYRKINEYFKCMAGLMPDDFIIYNYNSKINKIFLLTIESLNPDFSYGLYTKNNILVESCSENIVKLRVGEKNFNKD